MGPTPSCKVDSYPVVIRDRIIWVWLGEPDAANPESITRFPALAEPSFKFALGITRVAAHYELMTDNLLDLTHAVFMHPAFGWERHFPKVSLEKSGETVYSRYTNIGVPNPELTEQMFPTNGELVDTWDEICWTAPASHSLESGLTRTGHPREEGLRSPSVHILTPATLTSTTYFWGQGMPQELPLSEEDLAAEMAKVFEGEDVPMIEAVQARMGNVAFWDMQPMILRNDSSAVYARRILAQRLADENAARAKRAVGPKNP
jgi:vanillate O-demethylase monooxygenase subunit